MGTDGTRRPEEYIEFSRWKYFCVAISGESKSFFLFSLFHMLLWLAQWWRRPVNLAENQRRARERAAGKKVDWLPFLFSLLPREEEEKVFSATHLLSRKNRKSSGPGKKGEKVTI